MKIIKQKKCLRKVEEPTCWNFIIYNQSEENRMIHQIMSLFLNPTRWNKCDNIDTNKQSTKVITAIKFYSWLLINTNSGYVRWLPYQISIVTISSLYACACIKNLNVLATLKQFSFYNLSNNVFTKYIFILLTMYHTYCFKLQFFLSMSWIRHFGNYNRQFSLLSPHLTLSRRVWKLTE